MLIPTTIIFILLIHKTIVFNYGYPEHQVVQLWQEQVCKDQHQINSIHQKMFLLIHHKIFMLLIPGIIAYSFFSTVAQQE
jgi:hypothetical protein